MNVKEVLNNTVFLLGAGASVSAGCKTSSEMLSDLQIQINKLPDENQKRYFHDIFSFLIATLKFKFSLEKQDELAGRVINIEDFFMLLRQLIRKDSVLPQPFVGAWSHKVIQWDLGRPSIYSEFVNFILKHLKESWVRHHEEGVKKLIDPVKQLITIADIELVHFFTLNYDLVFESCFKTSVDMDTGFSNKVWRACFDDFAQSPQDASSSDAVNTIKLKYYKLHGSLDWWYDEDDEEVRLVDDVANNISPLLIFGTDEKVISVDPFLYLMGKFREQLNRSKLFIVVGYSFSDHHINNLLLQQLKTDPSKKILVVDPIFDDKKSRFDLIQRRKELVEYVEDVQKRKSSIDFKNVTKISEEKIDIVPLVAQEFYTQYFANGAQKLTEYYEAMQKAENVF